MKGKVGGKLSACLVVHGWVWLKEDVVVNIISHTHQENDFGLTLMVINDIYYIIHTAKLLLKYLSSIFWKVPRTQRVRGQLFEERTFLTKM